MKIYLQLTIFCEVGLSTEIHVLFFSKEFISSLIVLTHFLKSLIAMASL